MRSLLAYGCIQGCIAKLSCSLVATTAAITYPQSSAVPKSNERYEELKIFLILSFIIMRALGKMEQALTHPTSPIPKRWQSAQDVAGVYNYDHEK